MGICSRYMENSLKRMLDQIHGEQLNEEGLPFVNIIEEELVQQMTTQPKVTTQPLHQVPVIQSVVPPVIPSVVPSIKPKSKPINIVGDIKELYVNTNSKFLEFMRNQQSESDESDHYPEWMDNDIFGEEFDSQDSESVEDSCIVDKPSNSSECKKVRFSDTNTIKEYEIEEDYEIPRRELNMSRFKASKMRIHDE